MPSTSDRERILLPLPWQAPGAVCSDCVAFVSDEAPEGCAGVTIGRVARCLSIWRAMLHRSSAGLAFIPVPCALAAPAPAISAIAATEIKSGST